MFRTTAYLDNVTLDIEVTFDHELCITVNDRVFDVAPDVRVPNRITSVTHSGYGDVTVNFGSPYDELQASVTKNGVHFYLLGRNSTRSLGYLLREEYDTERYRINHE